MTPPSTTALYTAHEVEARTGIPATTLRQWERRYGFPSPARSSGGYRLYSDFDMSCLDFIRARQAEGLTVSRAVYLMREHLAIPARPMSGVSGPLVSSLVAALLAPDHVEAARLLTQAHTELGTEALMLSLIQPALVQIGLLWERGEITIAHEHLASAFLRSRVSQMLEVAGQDAEGPLVIAACGPGEFHEIGLMMLSVVLCRRGMQVRYLGANMPLSDLASYVRHAGAEALLLTMNTEESLLAFRAEQPELSGLKVPLYLGGVLLNQSPDLAAELGGAYLGGGALEAAEELRRRLKTPTVPDLL
ncbi:MerR family transcriptional regulator [Deinococcus sp. KNUC1210]|uniref:MerR family transcriptional regulator n=1 Tax=Deinococcus sp. KNUC1210 TaxID=2917691 RepID=UPI001EEFFC3E|nr:MerR family transcriptional regulator [Deinococcus sp. KNUC1210]ULH16346.1 MerR family transcriptional regulator [Deinococcus sp. KNUC1210]